MEDDADSSSLLPGSFRWLDAGLAALDPCGRIIELNESLAQFLGQLPADAPGQLFWPMLWDRFPGWRQPLDSLFQAPTFFTRRHLADGSGEPRAWFDLELVRHPAGCVVRISSALPPAVELAEGPWDESLQGEAAQRAMFLRLLRAESQLENLVRRWPGVIFSQRADFRFEFVSPRIGEFTGIEASQWLQQPNLFWQIVHESDLADFREQIRLATQTPAGAATTFRIRHRQTGRVEIGRAHV